MILFTKACFAPVYGYVLILSKQRTHLLTRCADDEIRIPITTAAKEVLCHRPGSKRVRAALALAGVEVHDDRIGSIVAAAVMGTRGRVQRAAAIRLLSGRSTRLD